MTVDIEDFLGHFDCSRRHDSTLALGDIDKIASIANQARFEALDAPTVERYVAALEDGDIFPPIIVRAVPRPKGPSQLVILGGNHRARAHIDAGRKTIDTWIVECSDLVAREIAYADNATHGLPPTDAERIAHALDLVERGLTQRDAARLVGINHQRIVKRMAAIGVEKRAAKAGVAGELAQFPDSVRYRLASIRDDRVFIKVIRAVVTNRIGSVASIKMIGDINAQPDVASAMNLLDAHIRQHRANEGVGRSVGHPNTNPYLMLRTALGTIRGLNAADVVERCSVRDLEELHELLIAGGRHLMAIDTLAQASRKTLTAVV